MLTEEVNGAPSHVPCSDHIHFKNRNIWLFKLFSVCNIGCVKVVKALNFVYRRVGDNCIDCAKSLVRLLEELYHIFPDGYVTILEQEIAKSGQSFKHQGRSSACWQSRRELLF